MRLFRKAWLATPVLCLIACVPVAAQAAGSCAFGTSIGGEVSLQNVFNDMFGASAAPNTVSDCINDPGDALWHTVSSVGSATILVEIAGNQNGNTLGIYDSASSLNSLELFSGPAASGSHAYITVSGAPGAYHVLVERFTQSGFAGSVQATFATSSFGFYLQQPGGAARFYSESFRNPGINGNSATKDYMYSYTGNGAAFLPGSVFSPDILDNMHFGTDDAIVAWEDLSTGSDQDYQDMVVLLRDIVPTASPVPLPPSVWLLAAALAALGLLGRRLPLPMGRLQPE